MTLVTQQDAFLMLFMASRAFNRFIVTVMRIGLELGCLLFYGISTLMAGHASRFLRNLSRLDVAMAGLTRQIHRLMSSFERHAICG